MAVARYTQPELFAEAFGEGSSIFVVLFPLIRCCNCIAMSQECTSVCVQLRLCSDQSCDASEAVRVYIQSPHSEPLAASCLIDNTVAVLFIPIRLPSVASST